jgi:hypothetical protein
MRTRTRQRSTRLTRRTFLKVSSTAMGMLLGGEPLLKARGRAEARGFEGGPAERRTYFFDLSHRDTSHHDFILVVDGRHLPLQTTQADTLARARIDHPILKLVPDQHITHQMELSMPRDELQLCQVRSVPRGATGGDWDMAMLFYHHPRSALREARRRAQQRAGTDRLPVPVKWQRYGTTSQMHAAFADPEGEVIVQDPTSHAIALVAGHPELFALEPNAATDIQQNVIGNQGATNGLAFSLSQQGSGWATQVPVETPPGFNPFPWSVSTPVWSQSTLQAAGGAISASLSVVKDSATYGVNVTGLDPSSITTGDPNAPTYGKIWTRRDGVPFVNQSPGAGSPAVNAASAAATPPTCTSVQPCASDSTTGPTYMGVDFSDDQGYAVTMQSMEIDSNGNPSVVLKVTNSYIRHLGLWVQYLDATGTPIPLANLTSVVNETNFPAMWNLGLNTTNEVFVNMLGPELNLFGIPLSTTSVTVPISIPTGPAGASSVLLLASGLGEGSVNPNPDTLSPGKVMTIIFELTLPAVFVFLAAATAFTGLISALTSNPGLLTGVLQVLLLLVADTVAAVDYDSPKAFENLGVALGAAIAKAAVAGALQAFLGRYVAGGQLCNAVPVVGQAASAIAAVGLAAQITVAAVDVSLSPPTYVYEVNLVHAVCVTILPDPDDPGQFPATATTMTTTAVFDGGTPWVQKQAVGQTDQIVVTFPNVPAGGNVTVNVGFYSDDGFLVGNGTVGPVPNTATEATLPLCIQITELKVPLTNTTTYSHKRIIVLGTDGTHQWNETPIPPAAATAIPAGQCDNAAGQICQWTGITVGTLSAAVGYAWEAYGSTPASCGSSGQVNQLANLSTLDTPSAETGRLLAGCGFSGVPRVVYDLMGTQRNFYIDPTPTSLSNPPRSGFVRQIHLSAGGPSSFDAPDSNLAWGVLQFPSDAVLLHPQGKIISLNKSYSKMEVLDLPGGPIQDASAPTSRVYSGAGSQPGRMNTPLLAAISPQGNVLVLEQGNNRVQAFDIHANPTPQFANSAYFFSLTDTPTAYLDLSVEYTGYMFVLSYVQSGGSYQYRLDIYNPDGSPLTRNTGIYAAKLAVDYWRNVYTLNYSALTNSDGTAAPITEPSVSQWIPSTP